MSTSNPKTELCQALVQALGLATLGATLLQGFALRLTVQHASGVGGESSTRTRLVAFGAAPGEAADTATPLMVTTASGARRSAVARAKRLREKWGLRLALLAVSAVRAAESAAAAALAAICAKLEEEEAPLLDDAVKLLLALLIAAAAVAPPPPALGWRFNKDFNFQMGYLNQFGVKSDGVKAERNHTLLISTVYNIDFTKKKKSI
jgi:hypothetical protein